VHVSKDQHVLFTLEGGTMPGEVGESAEHKSVLYLFYLLILFNSYLASVLHDPPDDDEDVAAER
jgi:hypothetical protein